MNNVLSEGELRNTITEALNILSEYIHLINDANGWFDSGRRFDADIALLHSEVSEAYEEYRSGRQINEIYYKLGKMEGIPSELADIIIRVLDTAHRYNIDIGAAIALKLENNQHRGYRHGGKIV